MYIFDQINFTYFAAVSKLGHFHSLHYAPVHSAVQMIPGHVAAMSESGDFCIYSCGDGVILQHGPPQQFHQPASDINDLIRRTNNIQVLIADTHTYTLR